MNPKGKLLIIGGAEAAGENEYLDVGGRNQVFRQYEILKDVFLKESKNRKIEIITTASRVPDEVRDRYREVFRDIDQLEPDFIMISEKRDADEENRYVKRVRESGAVFFTGGDQARLSDILYGTALADVIKEKYMYSDDFLVAGTSAGAMVMSSIMIARGGREEALFNKDLEIKPGLGLIDSCIVDTHFIKRGRFARLAHAIVKNPEKLGIGLGEDTAMLIKEGILGECRGSGMVIIIDGDEISETNIDKVPENAPIYVENLRVHLMVKGCVFNLEERTLVKAKDPQKIDQEAKEKEEKEKKKREKSEEEKNDKSEDKRKEDKGH